MVNVVSAYIEIDNKFLIAQRKSGKFKGLWEFPGGKVEIGETDEMAIEREIKEELEIDVKAHEFMASNIHYLPNKTIFLKLYRCEYITGQIKLNDHLDYRFIDKSEINNFEFCPGDIPIINEIIDTRIKKRTK